MGCESTQINTMKILTIIKTSPPICVPRDVRESLTERKKQMRMEKERKKQRKGSKKRRKKREKKQQTGKEKEMEKSSLSGFGNSDSWGPFVLITTEQRFCRY